MQEHKCSATCSLRASKVYATYVPHMARCPGQASAFHAAEAHHQMLGRQERDKGCLFVCLSAYINILKGSDRRG